MLPVIAIIGRPNVGKSTLFNYLTRSRAALVADMPGVTRDRLYGHGMFDDKPFIIIDTGGIDQNDTAIQSLMTEQAMAAIHEADHIFFVVDARAGLMPADQDIANLLRSVTKPIHVLVNKVDGLHTESALADFYSLGFSEIHPTVASQAKGVDEILTNILADLELTTETMPQNEKTIQVAVIGRPNVGKSTLINRILGEERVLVYDEPGTTRDSIFIPFTRQNQHYTLIDTAGVRRRRSISEAIEKFSVTKTLQAIEAANVIVYVINARENVSEQDLHLLGYIVEAGKALVITVNKWDGMASDERENVRKEIDRRLTFINFARIHYISALHGSGVGNLFTSIIEAYKAAFKKVSTPRLTNILEKAVHAHQPPAVIGRRIKLRYAHMGGHNPPVIVIHGNQTSALPDAYKRYLVNYFRKALHLIGTPIHMQFKTSENPYEGRKNKLTERQIKRRKRFLDRVKKK